MESTRRIRVGFISELFGPHIISDYSAGIMRQLPRDRFEVIGIHLFRKAHKTTAVSDFTDRTVRIEHKSLDETRRIIADLALDILFYTDIGMTPATYFLAFARLAHIQCVYGGHPVTTGIPNLDYFVSSLDAEPHNALEHYSEKLVQLEALAVHFPRFPTESVSPPNIRKRLNVSAAARLYTCPVTLFKFHPDFDEAIARILEADPAGHFIIIEGAEPQFSPALRHRLTKKFPAISNRILIIPRLSMTDFVGFLQEVDCVLDSFYFGAGTTAYYASAVGVPIVTLPSPYLRGRAGISVYQTLGVVDTLADDFDDYVAKAVRLANDKAWYQDLKRRILEKCDILFDRSDFIAELADFFEAALQAKLAGRPLIDWPVAQHTAAFSES